MVGGALKKPLASKKKGRKKAKKHKPVKAKPKVPAQPSRLDMALSAIGGAVKK